MASARLLLVDDDESVRSGLKGLLEPHGFEVVTASNVNEALKRIIGESFDVLVSDLHMPGAGDGLTVVSAMRHANPRAVTILLSANPDMTKAMAAIVKQADEILVKPAKAAVIVDVIRQRMAQDAAPSPAPATETAATILETETAAIQRAWLAQIQSGAGLTSVELSIDERCEHLPDALRDIAFRLRYPQPLGSTTLFSMAALQHGARRRRQGIGAATLVEESRALQTALFQVIEANLHRMDIGKLPATLMAIADEVAAQLHQSLSGYENEQPVDVPWGFR